jgi:hypothetical protein
MRAPALLQALQGPTAMKILAPAAAGLALAMALALGPTLPQADAAVVLAAAGLGLVWAQRRGPPRQADQASSRSGAR